MHLVVSIRQNQKWQFRMALESRKQIYHINVQIEFSIEEIVRNQTKGNLFVYIDCVPLSSIRNSFTLCSQNIITALVAEWVNGAPATPSMYANRLFIYLIYLKSKVRTHLWTCRPAIDKRDFGIWRRKCLNRMQRRNRKKRKHKINIIGCCLKFPIARSSGRLFVWFVMEINRSEQLDCTVHTRYAIFTTIVFYIVYFESHALPLQQKILLQ